MAGKRIYELLEKSTLEGTDYVAVDGSSLGEARKVAASKLLNFTNVAGSSDEYSSSKAYKVGDLVIHDNKLYKCTTACAAAPWSTNQGYFTQTTLASFGTDLKSSLAVQSGTIPTTDLALGFTVKWYKQGNEVYLLIANDTTKIPYGNTALGTLPSALRPKDTVYQDCNRSYVNKCSFTIGASGDVTVYCDIATGASSPYYVGASITYISE